MKKIFVSILLAGTLYATPAQKVSCNERVRHGPRGVYKTAAALLCAAGCSYFVLDIMHRAPDLRAPDELIRKEELKRWSTIKELFFKSLAATMLGYLSLQQARESYTSFSIFLKDDLEEDSSRS